MRVVEKVMAETNGEKRGGRGERSKRARTVDDMNQMAVAEQMSTPAAAGRISCEELRVCSHSMRNRAEHMTCRSRGSSWASQSISPLPVDPALVRARSMVNAKP